MNIASELSGVLHRSAVDRGAFSRRPCQNSLRLADAPTNFPAFNLILKRIALFATALAMLIWLRQISRAEQESHRCINAKSKGNGYFVSCKQGADQAAKDLGVELIFDAQPRPIRPAK